MSHVEQAITSTELRRSLVAIPDLAPLDNVNSDDLDRIILRNTALGLHSLGQDALPAEGTVDRLKLDRAVHRLSLNDVRRLLRPEDPEVLRELTREDSQTLGTLEALREQNPRGPRSWGGGVTGIRRRGGG